MAVTAPGTHNPADNTTIPTAWGDAVNADLTTLDGTAHARSHDHSVAGDGTSLSPATLIIPGATSPAQTAEGSAVWDTNDDRLTIGDGAGRKTIYPDPGSGTTYDPNPTNITMGNGTKAGRYLMMGAKLCWVNIMVTLGSTSSITGSVVFALPFASIASVKQVLTAEYRQSGTRFWSGIAQVDPSGTLAYLIHTESGNAGQVNATNPFTFASTHELIVTGTYEIA